MTGILDALARAAWVEGWLEVTHPDSTAYQHAKAIREVLAKLVTEEAARMNITLEWINEHETDQ